MKKIEFEVAGRRYPYEVPERWEEVTQEQFVLFADGIDGKEGLETDTVRRIIGLDDVVTVNLTIADWWILVQEMRWMEDLESYEVGLMDSVTLPDGTVYHGFSDNFSDVTWEEWMYADHAATQGKWDVVTAILYRPEKTEWDHESDNRVAFTPWGAEARLEGIRRLDSAVLKAVALNYKLMRKRFTRRYRRIFTESATGKGGGGSDLQTLIRTVMGDNFYEEEKYLKLTVPAVLFQLDRMVREERERRRRARTN